MIERSGRHNLYPDAVVSSSSVDSTACECEVTCEQQRAVLLKAKTGIRGGPNQNGPFIPCEVEAKPTKATTDAVLPHTYHDPSTPQYRIASSYYMEEDASKTAYDALSFNLDFIKIISLVNTECFPQSCILARLANCL